ncbi:MAG: PAS domain S-box protein [Halanaeroarchaeum sp.]
MAYVADAEAPPVATALERHGIPGSTTGLSVEATTDLASTGGDPPACVVVDRADPFEVVSTARAAYPSAKTVLLAEESDADIAARAVNEGVDRFVVATGDPDDDAAAVAETIGDCLGDSSWITLGDVPAETILDRVPIPVFALDADHSVVYWNDAVESLTGRSAAAVAAGDDPHDPFYDDERPVLANMVVDGADEAALDEWYDDWEQSPYSPDGYVGEGHFPGVGMWLQFAVNPITDASGETIGAIEALHDITPRKERERELERYETVLEAAGDPVYTLDAAGNFTFVNDALTDVTGYDRSELIGEHVSKVMVQEDIERGESLIRDLLESGEESRGTFEMDVVTADGETIAAENHIATLPYEDEFRGTVGTIRDISERKRRERNLQEQRDRFTAVFETIPEPIAHVSFEDEGPVVENVNSAFAETFGVEKSAIRGSNINDLIVPDDLIEEARAIDRTARVEEFVEREVQRRTADDRRDFLLRATRFAVGDDDRESIVAYLDITDQKQRQRALERQNERLDEFASVVSHDLRNPLNVAAGRLALAREDHPEDENLAHVASSLDRMESLIEDLLALAVQGDSVSEPETLDVATIAERSWRHVDSAPGATLEVDVDGSIVGERSRVRSLFENLFRNAVEHGGDDVTVTVTGLPDGFAVEDDGPGLPDDGSIFESGFSTNDQGTGFGLNIVAEIVDAHGWSISAGESPAGGARFEIRDVASAEQR